MTETVLALIGLAVFVLLGTVIFIHMLLVFIDDLKDIFKK